MKRDNNGPDRSFASHCRRAHFRVFLAGFRVTNSRLPLCKKLKNARDMLNESRLKGGISITWETGRRSRKTAQEAVNPKVGMGCKRYLYFCG